MMECFCQGPQCPVCLQIKDSSVCFQHGAFGNELDVFGVGCRVLDKRRFVSDASGIFILRVRISLLSPSLLFQDHSFAP